METTLKPSQSDTTCPQCEQHLDEIARLQAELTELREERGTRRTGRWWGLAAAGVFILAMLAHAPAVMIEIVDQLNITFEPEWIAYALWGSSIGLPWALWSLIGIFCVLHEGAVRQRVLIYAGLCGIFAATTLLRIAVIDSGNEEFAYLTYAGPLLTVVMAIPAYLARVLRRWTVTLRSSKTPARPITLASYLTVMTILGVTFTAMKFYPWGEIASSLDDVAVYLLVFGGPLITVGCLQLWMLPTMLGLNDGRSISWRQWLLLGAIVTIGSLSSIGGYAAFLAYERITDWTDVAELSALPVALIISAAIYLAVGYFWLHKLDYELRTA